MAIGTQAVREACQLIINDHKSRGVLWAVNYASYCVSMVERNAPIEEIKTQCLYVLNNIQHWRGKDAKLVRDTLKAFCNSTN